MYLACNNHSLFKLLTSLPFSQFKKLNKEFLKVKFFYNFFHWQSHIRPLSEQCAIREFEIEMSLSMFKQNLNVPGHCRVIDLVGNNRSYR